MAPIQKIILTLIAGIAVNIVIFIRAELPNFENNGFIRSFLPAQAILNERLDVPSSAMHIAGTFGGTLYLATDDPAILISVDMQANRTSTVNLTQLANWLSGQKITDTYTTLIDSPHYYIFAHNLPGIHVYDLIKKRIEVSQATTSIFTSGIPLSSASFALRQYSNAEKAFRFSRTDRNNGTVWEQDLSLPSADMGLSTDGRLLFDREAGLVVYMHYYNNRIIVSDTTLNKVRSFSLLDTVAPKRQLAPDAPRIMTNSEACLHRGLLYVCSNLRADNEPYKEYIKHIPVDIFDVRNGLYLGSFYLPALGGKLIKSMDIVENRLIALYFNDQIASFTIPILL